jgi:hypothetical protein
MTATFFTLAPEVTCFSPIRRPRTRRVGGSLLLGARATVHAVAAIWPTLSQTVSYLPVRHSPGTLWEGKRWTEGFEWGQLSLSRSFALHFNISRLLTLSLSLTRPPDLASPPSPFPPSLPGLPIFHSKPGSENVVFLDFDGDKRTADSTIWGAFSNAGYNPSGTPGDFDSYEQDRIKFIWQRVAEDFAPFDVDITTEEPATYTRRTLQCLIADKNMPDGSSMPNSGAGGVAYINIFGRTKTRFLSPAFVYWNNLNGRQ